MRRRKGTLFVCLSIIAVHGMVASQTFNPSDAVETTGSGKINWTSGEVFATGIGAPPAHPANAAQARAMAVRAAQVVAYRNLLETVKGVRVDSETVVENFMTKSDVIRVSVDGIVKGAQIIKTQYLSDGSVEVLVSMPLKGALMDTIVPERFGAPAASMPFKPMPSYQATPGAKTMIAVPEKKAEPSKPGPSKSSSSSPRTPTVPERRPAYPAPSAAPEKKPELPKQPETPTTVAPSPSGPSVDFKGGVATGLVIDGRGLGLRPALLPKILDQQGQEVYVGQVVTRTNAVEQGVAGYAKDVNAAANNFRVTDNPAVMKALKAAGTARTDLVVGQADAQTLRQLNKTGDFLQYCRVIIVY